MDLGVALVVVAGIGAYYSLKSKRMASGQGETGFDSGLRRFGSSLMSGEVDQPSAREQELQREVDRLKERINVLERIATDPRTKLASEIEALRDERSVIP
jgi:uncharacterized protein YlxW (UPF0749 family)